VSSSPLLSIVIPAYNEERRLPRTLNRTTAYLERNLHEPFEIVVVDDGSRDRTCALVEAFAVRHPQVRLLRQPANKGRGAAVREGIKACRGEFILETDADGSVEDEAITRFCAFLRSHPSVDALIGSRNVAGAEILTPQPVLRVALGYGFLWLAKALFGWYIQDYTLGFKMFRREAALDIFSRQFDDSFLAEGELVHVALRRGWRVYELPTLWTDFRESRVNPLRDSARSFAGLLGVLRRERAGLYREGAPRPSFAQAAARAKALYSGLGWPSLFNRIRFFTAPYNQLEPLVPLSGVIVDLGCGYGTFSNLLKILSPQREIIGLELDDSKLRLADRGLGCRFEVADIRAADIPPADCLLLIHVLHHLDSYAEQEELLRVCLDKLKKGGRLLINEVDRRPLWKLALGRLADAILYPGDRVYYRYQPEMSALLSKLGVSFESYRSHYGTPFSHTTYVAFKP
jgi:dolichyl-phosphate beta-glucosyltransferase